MQGPTLQLLQLQTEIHLVTLDLKLMFINVERQQGVKCISTCADPEGGGDRGSGPPPPGI